MRPSSASQASGSVKATKRRSVALAPSGRLAPAIASLHPDLEEPRRVLAQDFHQRRLRQTGAPQHGEVNTRMAQGEVAAEEHALRPNQLYHRGIRLRPVEPRRRGRVHVEPVKGRAYL